MLRRILVCFVLLLLASTLLGQSRGGRGRPGTGNPEELFVPWKFLPKGTELVKGPVVVYWLPATLAETEHSPLRTSQVLLDDSARCVALEIVAPDDAVTIAKLGATGKLPMALITNSDGRVVREVDNTRPKTIEQMVSDELSARDNAVLRELSEAKRMNSVELYKKIWDNRCLYPLVWRMLAPGLLSVPVGAFVSRCHVQLSGVGSVLPAGSVARTAKVCELSVRPGTLCGLVHGAKEPPSTLAPDPNLKVTNPTTTRH